jgi:hypothetical protein
VPPILVLEGLQVPLDEPFEITVLGPPPAGGGPPPVLAVTGTVGSPSAPPTPPRKMTMPIPLNEEAAKLLADRDEVTLTLRVAGRPGRGPLKFDRAYFREP